MGVSVSTAAIEVVCAQGRWALAQANVEDNAD